jgi:hypothetical protein
MGITLGLRGIQIAGSSSRNWTPQSLVVEDAAPTHVVMTGLVVNTDSVAGDFTIAGFTVLSLAKDITNKILTLTLSATVTEFDSLIVNYKGLNYNVTNNVSDAPSDLMVTTISGGHRLTWTDNSGVEDGYEISVSINSGAFAVVGQVLTDVVTYDDTVTAGSPLTYKVRAFKNFDYSDFSDAVQSTYCTEALSLFTRMPVQMPDTWKDVYNLKMLDAKTAGFWQLFDTCWLLGGYDDIGSLLNITENDHNCSKVSTPTFTQKKGWQGGAGSGKALATDYFPNVDSVHFQRNSACIFFMLLTDGDVSNQRAQMGGGVYDIGVQVKHPSGCFIEVNQDTFAGYANPTSIGRYISNRKGANVLNHYKDGVLKLAATDASKALTTWEQWLLAYHLTTNLWGPEQMFIAGYSGGLTDQQCLDLDAWMLDFYNKIQAL